MAQDTTPLQRVFRFEFMMPLSQNQITVPLTNEFSHSLFCYDLQIMLLL